MARRSSTNSWSRFKASEPRIIAKLLQGGMNDEQDPF
jgi:hypothetical protein